MNEYLQLEDMRPVDNPERDKPHFYFPQHAVIKENSFTRKVRVVLDSSAKTIFGISLNATLMVEPKLQ